MACHATTTATVAMTNTGSTTWTSAGGYGLAWVDGPANAFLPAAAEDFVVLPGGLDVPPGGSASFQVPLRAPLVSGTFDARFRMVAGTTTPTAFGPVVTRSVAVSCAVTTGCTFPQGVPDPEYTGHTLTNAMVANLVNTTMEQLSGCPKGSDCSIGDRYTDQTWFAAVTASLRAQGLCAGQHEVGHTDEIAVSYTSCGGLWYGYHVFNYGGSKVVWNNGAQRGSWSIQPQHCPP